MSTPFYNNIIFFQITVFYVPAVSRRIRSLALLSAVSEHLSSRNTDFLFRDLLFRKSSTGGLSAVAGSAALDIHMLRHALVIAVINTFYRLTVDADRMAWMRQGAAERIPPLSLLRKAFTAGSVTVAGMLASHHDITLAAHTILIIGTIFHNTFQICHVSLTFCRFLRLLVSVLFLKVLKGDTRQKSRCSSATRHG